MGLALAAPIAASAAKLVTGGDPTALFSGQSVKPGQTYELASGSAATSNLIVTVESTVQFASFADRDELAATAGDDYIGAIVATTNDTGAGAWFANDGASWVKLSDLTPATDTVYVVKTELDLATKKLRHSVKKKSGDGDFTALYKTTSGDWLPANTGKPALSSIMANGKFETVTLSGRCPASSNIAVAGAGSIAFEPTALAAIGVNTDGKTDVEIASSLAGKGSNGIANWQNYVLGLRTDDANAKPYTAPVQNADSSKLTFSLGGVDVNASSGATVRYGVQVADSPTSFREGDPDSDWVDSGETVEMTAEPSGVKYYRIKVKIDAP